MLNLLMDLAVFLVATDVTKMVWREEASRAFFGYFRKLPI